MKVKIREISNSLIPSLKYNGTKNVLTLTVREATKYLTLYAGSLGIIEPKVITYTQTPQIRNYSKYNKFSSTTISSNLGCQTVFGTPNYIFPSWDLEISQYPGITFGGIQLKDFFTLQKNIELPDSLTDYPNINLTC